MLSGSAYADNLIVDGNPIEDITVRLPVDPWMVGAMYISRLSQGVLKDYTCTELMTSTGRVDVLKRVPALTTPVK